MTPPCRTHRAVATLLAASLAAAAHAAPPSWQPLGPYGGTVQTLTSDPGRPDTLYATRSFGPVYRTVDGGASWTRSLPAPTAGAVAIDPRHPATLYVGAYTDPEILRNVAIFKSADGGATWASSRAGLPAPHFVLPVSLAVDPAEPRRLLLAYGLRLWRSNDAAESWQPSIRGLPAGTGAGAQAVAFAARPAGTAFAATSAGLFRTADAGLSWKRMERGIPVAAVSLLAVAATDPRTVYAYLASAGLYRTTDGGYSWQRAAAPSAVFGTALAVAPRSPRTLYSVGAGKALYRSIDGGARWALLPGAAGATSVALPANAPRRIYAGSEAGLGGVLRSDDGGASWARRNQGLTGIAATELAVAPEAPGHLWMRSGNALFRSANGGRRWARAAVPASRFAVSELTAGEASHIFLAVPFEIPGVGVTAALERSPDGGASWQPVIDPVTLDVSRIRTAPSAPSTVYASGTAPADGADRLYRSIDGGDTWELRSIGAAGSSCASRDLAVAPSAADVLYRATAHFDPALSRCAGGVLRSGDGGATWSAADGGLPDPTDVAALAVDPGDPDRLFASTGGDGLWKSADGGRTWSFAGDTPTPRDLFTLIVPVAGRLYTVSGDRVWRSDDEGATWSDRTRGLRVTAVHSLAADPGDPRRLYAATSNGVWTLADTD